MTEFIQTETSYLPFYMFVRRKQMVSDASGQDHQREKINRCNCMKPSQIKD